MGGRGMTAMLCCSNCGRSVPKDKAIKRFTVRNIVDASSQRDIRDASLYQQYMLPKLFIKIQYCVSCAIHNRTVRVRQVALRKNRGAGKAPVRESAGTKAPAGAVKPKAEPTTIEDRLSGPKTIEKFDNIRTALL